MLMPRLARYFVSTGNLRFGWNRRFAASPVITKLLGTPTIQHGWKLLSTTHRLTAGHSKWANIRHIKALKDGQKSATFTRLSRQIRLAIQEGGSANPALNSSLRSIIDIAIRQNMPMSTIQNCIKKSEQNKNQLKKHIIEIRVKQKICVVCILYTDNFAGLKMEMATIVKKAGAAFTEAVHMFDDCGIIEAFVKRERLEKIKNEDDLEELATEDAIDCGAEELDIIDHKTGAVNFICNPIQLTTVSRAFQAKGYEVENTEHVFIPKVYVQLTDADLKSYEIFVKKMRDLPGVEDIYDNVQQST